MTAGLQIFNDNGVIQIDELFKNPRLVTRGFVAERNSSNFGDQMEVKLTPFGINMDIEIPVILLRPTQLNQYVGGVALGYDYNVSSPHSIFFTRSDNYAYEYAIFATTVPGVVDPTINYGLQVFLANGELAYSTANSHARILANLFKPAPGAYPYPYSFGIPNTGAMPWFLGNPLMYSPWFPEDGPVTGIFMKADSFGQVTVGHQLLEEPQVAVKDRLNVFLASNLDPYNYEHGNGGYQGRDAVFSIANFA